MLLRTVLDPVTGDLSDTRTRYLGSRPVKLFRVRMQGQEAVREESSCRGADPLPRHHIPDFLMGGQGGEASLQHSRTLWVRVGSRMTSLWSCLAHSLFFHKQPCSYSPYCCVVVPCLLWARIHLILRLCLQCAWRSLSRFLGCEIYLTCCSAQRWRELCAGNLPLNAWCSEWLCPCMLRIAQPRAGQLPYMVQGKYLQDLA